MRTRKDVPVYRTALSRDAVAALFRALLSLGIVLLLSLPAWTGEAPAVPRSDGRALHVDFEGYVDRVIGPLNAGVRFLGHPFAPIKQGQVEVVHDAARAFAGKRCGHIQTESADQIGRILLQRRYNAPTVKGDEITEFVFRPANDKPTDLDNLTVWSESVYQPADDKAARLEDLDVWAIVSYQGSPGAIVILANGSAADGTYSIDVRDKTGLIRQAVKNLKQAEWIRFVLLRRRTAKAVDLWAGPVGRETFIGTYADLHPAGAFGKAEFGDLSLKASRGAGSWDDVRVGAVLRPGDAVAPAEVMRHVGREPVKVSHPIAVGRERQLFADDLLVESMKGLHRKLNPVKKHPKNPLVVSDQPWEGVVRLRSVIKDPTTNKFRMWYLSWGKSTSKPSYNCYAESDDGIRWTKPKLGILEALGSPQKDNNCVLLGGTELSLLYDPLDPDATRRYKLMRRLNGNRAMFSADGLNWRDGGVMMDQIYDCSHVHWNPVDKMWNAEIKISWDSRRARGFAESKDFQNWTDTYLMLTIDEKDDPSDQMYGMGVSWYETLFAGFVWMYNTKTDKMDVELATSRNGRRWDRLFRDPLIPTGAKGTWDYGMVNTANTPPIRVGDELWIYYTGMFHKHGEPPRGGGVGLATIRADGFVSVNAGDEKGLLVTRPVTLCGKSLFVNAAVGAGGHVKVELRDGPGKPIADYALAQCTPITADAVRIPVAWGDRKTIDPAAGQNLKLAFELKNARLYSFWAE